MFDFDKFKAGYFEDNALNLANRDVYALFNRYISELQKSGNVGNLEKPDYLTTFGRSKLTTSKLLIF